MTDWYSGFTPETPCRIWRKIRKRQGRRRYPVKNHEGRVINVSHWVWGLINGPVPRGLVIMHLCDEPWCYRYDHLRLGTHAENMADRDAKGRRATSPGSLRTHCPAGHPYDVANTRWHKGGRWCRQCGRDHSAAHYRHSGRGQPARTPEVPEGSGTSFTL